MVLTPARLEQPRTAVPASVSVIDRTLIAATGARTVVEALRLVPGMVVTYRDGYNPVVSYHGTSYRDFRRLQVLVDGRSVYQPGLASVDWNSIPLAVEDIERIEVTRGPDSAAYGANAFLGVINIITRDPRDSLGTTIKATRGSSRGEDYYASHGTQWENNALRVSAGSRHDDGFDVNRDNEERRDSHSTQFGSVRWLTEFANDWSLDSQVNISRALYTEDFNDEIMPPNIDIEHTSLSAKLEHDFSPTHHAYLQANWTKHRSDVGWRSCFPALAISPELAAMYRLDPKATDKLIDDGILPSNPNSQLQSALDAVLDRYSRVGLQETCGNFNDNNEQTRSDLEWQSTLAWPGRGRLVLGANLRQESAESDTYYNGKVTRDSARLFGHLEARLSERWQAHLGGMWENDQNTEGEFMPRAGLIFSLSPDHSLRAVYSEALRTPDLMETHADWNYYVSDVSPVVDGLGDGYYYAHAIGNRAARPERIRSRELGYYGFWRQHGLSWDVRFFHDDMEDLISRSLDIEGFSVQNTSWLEHIGAETEIEWRPPTSRGWVRFTYARIEFDTNNYREYELTPEDSGNLLAGYDLGHGWQASAGYYYVHGLRYRGTDKNTIGTIAARGHKYSRLDLRIAKTIPLGDAELEVAGLWQHRVDDDPDLLADNIYKEDDRAWLTLTLSF